MPEFVPFRFEVSLYHRSKNDLLCRGYFSEVTGLEVTMEPRAIQEGGRNWGEVQRVGQTRFSPIVLKRGVTEISDLWTWFDTVTQGQNHGYRLRGTIKILGGELDDQNQAKPVMTWSLEGVMPTRFKGPDLSSTASQVAIEEVTLIHESLTLQGSNGS